MSEFKTKPSLLPFALAASIVLSGIIGWMIAERAAILRDGREVILKVVPLDPRDLLRGRYVLLGFEARRVPLMDAETRIVDFQRYDDSDVFVLFQAGPDGHHVPVNAVLEQPQEGIFIMARSLSAENSRYDDGAIYVDYGMGRFYTNEQRAPLLEQRMRDGEITTIIAAVDGSGRPQIKALRQGNDVIVTEPLY